MRNLYSHPKQPLIHNYSYLCLLCRQLTSVVTAVIGVASVGVGSRAGGIESEMRFKFTLVTSNLF